jgi:para-nitrobenzyl esterase
MNYRLGLFGFWRNPELTAKQPSAPTNFGLLDQQAALDWIHKYIQYFGGLTV